MNKTVFFKKTLSYLSIKLLTTQEIFKGNSVCVCEHKAQVQYYSIAQDTDQLPRATDFPSQVL